MENQEIISFEQQQKQLNLLGHIDFPKILDSMNLNFELYNKLFAAHILTIGIQSVGINDGSVSLTYLEELSKNNDPNSTQSNHRPQIDYAFYTTKNALIENRQTRTSRTSQPVYNKYHEFSYTAIHSYNLKKSYATAFEFHQFLNEYLTQVTYLTKSEAHILKKPLEERASLSLKIKVRPYLYNTKKEKTEHLYEKIIEDNPEIQNTLHYYLLSQELMSKDNNNARPKI